MTEEEKKEIKRLFEEAKQHYNKGEYTEANECYDKVLAIDPNHIGALNNKGLSLSNLGKYKKAIEYYDKVLNIDKNNLDTLNNKGLSLAKLGKYTEAIEYYDKVLAIDPNHIGALNNKGNTLASLERNTEAIDCYDKVLKIDPNNISALNGKAIALQNLRKFGEAIKFYDKVLNIDKNNLDTLNNKGVALANLEKYTEAIECYDTILNIDPKNIMALNNKGAALLNIEKYTEALECFEKVLKIDAKNVISKQGKAIALLNLGEFKESKKWYDKIPLEEENNITTLNGKAIALQNQGKFEEATVLYEKVLARDEKNKEALNGMAICFLYIKDKTADQCLEYFRRTGKNTLQIVYSFKVLTTDQNKKLKEIVQKFIDEDKDPFYSFLVKNRVDIIHNVKELYFNIYFQTLQIVSLLHVTGKKEGNKDFSQEQQVAHYTKRESSYNMLLKNEVKEAKEEKSPLRLNTIAKGNDPKEGKTLFDYLDIDRDCDTANDDYQAFIACFTFNKQSLNQFRLYGKEHQREATGVSLVVSNSYFNKKIGFNGYFNNLIGFNGSLFNSIEISEKKEEKLSLFRCIYIDPQTHQVISIGHKEEYEIYRDEIDIKEGDTIKEIEEKGKDIREKIKSYNIAINAQLEKVRTQLSSLNKYINDNKDKLDMQVVKELLIMLRYLVKHVAFKEEQECRILRIEKIDNDEVKVENNIHMFIDYKTIDDAVKTIYTGPMFEDAKLYRDVIRRQCKDIEVCTCDHPFFSK